VPKTVVRSGINPLKVIGKNANPLKFGPFWPMFGDMEDQFYYSTGKAGRELGASQDTVRALCNSGVIRAVPTNGRQWRIPAREVERLKREGLPPVPRPMPGDGPVTRNASARLRMNGYQDGDADPHRAAGRERDVIQAYAGAARKHAMIEEREADWRLMELEDRFRARENEVQTRQRKHESEVQHADWLRAVEKAALDLLDIKAPGAPPQMRLDLHKAIRERFAPLNPIPADQVTGELIAGAVQPFLDRHREQKAAEQIIIDARDYGLPVDARAEPWDRGSSEWQRRLLRLIADRLGDGDYPLDAIRDAVKQAVLDVTREFEEHQAALKAENADRQAAEADAELRRRVREDVTRPLRHRLSNYHWTDMQEAIDARFTNLPRGTRRSTLETECRQAVARWREPLEELDRQQRQRDQRDVARRMREEVIRAASWKLPFDLSEAEKDRALAEVRKRIEEQPDSADRPQLEKIRDETMEPRLDAHERRSQAERRVDSLLDESIRSAVAGEERDGLEFDGPLDRVDLVWELKAALRPAMAERFARITNLNAMSDEVIRREIEGAARRRIEELVPER